MCRAGGHSPSWSFQTCVCSHFRYCLDTAPPMRLYARLLESGPYLCLWQRKFDLFGRFPDGRRRHTLFERGLQNGTNSRLCRIRLRSLKVMRYTSEMIMIFPCLYHWRRPSGAALKEQFYRLLPGYRFEFVLASSDYIFRKPHSIGKSLTMAFCYTLIHHHKVT